MQQTKSYVIQTDRQKNEYKTDKQTDRQKTDIKQTTDGKTDIKQTERQI